MSAFTDCPTCGVAYPSWRTHKCDPVYRAWVDDEDVTDEEFMEIRTDSIEQAAEIFCDLYDSNGEYSIVARSYADVIVIDPDGNRHKVFVEAEANPRYYSKTVEQI